MTTLGIILIVIITLMVPVCTGIYLYLKDVEYYSERVLISFYIGILLAFFFIIVLPYFSTGKTEVIINKYPLHSISIEGEGVYRFKMYVVDAYVYYSTGSNILKTSIRHCRVIEDGGKYLEKKIKVTERRCSQYARLFWKTSRYSRETLEYIFHTK